MHGYYSKGNLYMKKLKFLKVDVANKQYHIVLALSYIILCAISIICLLIAMFSWFRSYLKNEIYQMSLVQLNNTSQIVSNQINNYRLTLQNMFQEPNIKSSLYTDSFDPLNEWNISRYLNYSFINDGCIDYSVIYKDGTIKQIIGPVYPQPDEQAQVIEYLKSSQSDKELFYIQPSPAENRFFLIRTERDAFGQEPQRGVIFAINQQNLSNVLFTSDNKNNNFFVFDNTGHMLLNQGFYSENLEETLWSYIKNIDHEESMYELALDDNKYYLVCIQDNQYNFKYAQLINVNEINSSLHDSLTFTLIYVAFVMTICTLLALFLAYFISYPLRNFIKKLTAYTNLNMGNSEYNEELTKLTSEKIIFEISRISRQFHSDKVLSYLEDSPVNTAPPHVMNLKENKEKALLIYVGSKIGKLNHTQFELLQTYIKEEFKNSPDFYFFPEEHGYYYIILVKEQCETDCSQILLLNQNVFISRLQKALSPFKATDSTIFTICSTSIDTAEEFQSSFRNLQQLSKYVLFDEVALVCSSSDFLGKQDTEIPFKEFQPVINCVKKGDDVEAKMLMISVIKTLRNYEIKRIFHSLSYFASELDKICAQFSSHASQSQEVYLDNYIKLTSLINQKQLYDYLSNIIEDACIEVRTFKERSIRTNMSDSIQYINEHFQDTSISVEQVAGLFHISTSYYSRMFNEICNLTFPEYVTELRLNYSVQLLENSNCSIKEIAGRSGFSNVSYFSSLFKKKYGVSPSSYRNNKAIKS